LSRYDSGRDNEVSVDRQFNASSYQLRWREPKRTGLNAGSYEGEGLVSATCLHQTCMVKEKKLLVKEPKNKNDDVDQLETC
jgi:hypothetical protein